MENRVEDIIRKINERRSDIKLMNNFIDKQREIFEEAVADARQVVDVASQEIGALRSKTFMVSVEDVLRGLANVWGVNREDVVVEMRTNQDHARMYEYGADDFWDDILRNPSRRNRITLHFSAWAGEKDGAKKVEFSKKVDLDSVQADGKGLWEHALVDATKTKEGYNHFALKFDSYENVLLNYALDDLLSEPSLNSALVCPKDEYSEAVLWAMDNADNKNQEVSE